MPSAPDEQGPKRKRKDRDSLRKTSKRAKVEGSDGEDGTSNKSSEKKLNADTTEKPAAAKRRKRGKHSETSQETQPTKETGQKEGQAAQDGGEAETEKKSKKRRESKEHDDENGTTTKSNKSITAGSKTKKRTPLKQSWIMSEPTGGTFIDMKPLFSADEKYLICATQNAVFVYSTSDSLLTAKLPCNSTQSISGYALSIEDPSILFVCTTSGYLTTWKWKEGIRLGGWKSSSRKLRIQCAKFSDRQRETVFTLDDDNEYQITAHERNSEDGSMKTDVATLLKTQKPIRSFIVTADGRVIIAITSDSIMCGVADSPKSLPLEDLKYSWHEISCNEAPLCLDTRTRKVDQSSLSSADKKDNVLSTFAVDVIVGGIKGVVYLYKDILRAVKSATRTGNTSKDNVSTSVHEFHWHREAVGTVAWSRDGNYIISGGRETVLVLWQLETGKQQFLPHLESPIENLTVSPNGSSYGVLLGDNSAMVLSTGELAPSANITGLQSFSFVESTTPQPMLPTVELLANLNSDTGLSGIRAAMNPLSPNEMLLAVPAYQAKMDNLVKTSSAPYLQKYDVYNHQSLSRQALARTNATNVNLGPEGNRIHEPDIAHLQLTYDGKWLVTASEWNPPQESFGDLSLDDLDEMTEWGLTREVQLKFWTWDADQKTWMLNSRVDIPHIFDNTRVSGRILDMKTNPTRSEIVTIGEDGKVRFWFPRRSLKNGKMLRDRQGHNTAKSSKGSESPWWDVLRTISFEKSIRDNPLEQLWPSRAKVAYSNDGSLLAVTLQFEDESYEDHGLVHFVDTERGIIEESMHNLCTTVGKIESMEFLDHYLVVVGDRGASVWNVTSFTHQWSISFEIPAATRKKRNKSPGVSPQLAVNVAAKTFAIATAEFKKKSKGKKGHPVLGFRGRVRVYNFDEGINCVFDASTPSPILALLPTGNSNDGLADKENDQGEQRGFVVVDSQASIRLIRPKGKDSGKSKPKTAAVNGEADASEALDGQDLVITKALEEDENHVESEEATNLEADATADMEDSRRVVRPEKLADILDYPSHAVLAGKDLFSSVVQLFTGAGDEGH